MENDAVTPVEPVIPTEPTETLTPAEARKLKIKFDGVETEVDEEEVIKGYQKATGADKKFQEAAKLKREADKAVKTQEAQFEALLQDEDFLLKLAQNGYNLDKALTKFLKDRESDSKLSPEDKELRQYRKEKADREAVEKETKIEKAAKEFREQLEAEIIPEVEKHGMKPTAKVIKMVGQKLAIAFNHGISNITVADVVPYVKQELINEHNDLWGSYTEEDILDQINPTVLEKINKAKLLKAGKGVAKLEKPIVVDKEKAGIKKQEPFDYNAWANKR